MVFKICHIVVKNSNVVFYLLFFSTKISYTEKKTYSHTVCTKWTLVAMKISRMWTEKWRPTPVTLFTNCISPQISQAQYWMLHFSNSTGVFLFLSTSYQKPWRCRTAKKLANFFSSEFDKKRDVTTTHKARLPNAIDSDNDEHRNL